MDLTAVTDVVTGHGPGQHGMPVWQPGDAWLAGGTWLFSQPQPQLRRLLDLTALGWPALEPAADGGLVIGATCTVAALHEFFADPPAWAAGWTVTPLVTACCNAFLASFKVLGVATVGGNLCTALPAGPMITLAVALDGTCVVWRPDGTARQVPAIDLVTGEGTTVLQPGEVLRALHVPAPALQARTAVRRASLATYGRSAALVAGCLRVDDGESGGRLTVTVTGATRRPVRLAFDRLPGPAEASAALEAAVPEQLWHDDVHGLPAWRAHLARTFTEQVRAELVGASR